MLWVISTTTLRQTVTPAHLLGRVSALAALATGARTVGAGLGAVLAGIYGAEAALLAALLLFVVQAAVILVSPAAGLVRQPAPA
jgi:hypothetical protein